MAAAALFAMAGVTSCKKDTGGVENKTTKTKLEVSPASVTFVAKAAAAQTLTVTTDAAEWSIGTPADWYTATKDGNKIAVTPKDNVGEAREHILVVSAKGADAVKVTVKQAAGEKPAQQTHKSLLGSKYIVFQLDMASRTTLGDKIAMDLAPDNTSKFIDYWNQNNMGAATGTNPGFYGNAGEGYFGMTRLKVGDWAWGGFRIAEKDKDDKVVNTYDYNVIDGEWFFHIAVMGSPDAKHGFSVDFGNKTAGGNPDMSKFFVGAGTDKPVSLTEWTEVEIPVSKWLDAGWVPSSYEQRVAANDPGANGLCFGIETAASDDAQLFIDACFFYKK